MCLSYNKMQKKTLVHKFENPTVPMAVHPTIPTWNRLLTFVSVIIFWSNYLKVLCPTTTACQTIWTSSCSMLKQPNRRKEEERSKKENIRKKKKIMQDKILIKGEEVEWENKKRKKKKKQLQSLQCGMLQIMKWFLNNKQVTFSTVCLKVTWRANKQWAFVWCSFFKTGIIAPGGPLTCSTQGSPSQRWAVSNTEEAEWSCTRNGPSEPLPATSHKKFFFFFFSSSPNYQGHSCSITWNIHMMHI